MILLVTDMYFVLLSLSYPCWSLLKCSNSRISSQIEILCFFNYCSSMMPFADTEDASETDLAKHDEDDYIEIKEQ